MECNKILQNVTELPCLFYQMLQNTGTETTYCCKMIYKLIKAPIFHNILIHFVNKISTFR